MTRFRMFWKLYRESFRIGRLLTKEEARELLLAPELNAARNLFYATIGQLVVIWASTEVLLDMANVIILNETKTQHSHMPEQLGRKIKLFEQSFIELEELSQFRVGAIEAIKKVKELKEVRHDIIHGLSTENLPYEALTFIRHGYRGKVIVANTKKYSLKEINGKASEILELNEKLVFLIREMDAFFKNKPKHLYG